MIDGARARCDGAVDADTVQAKEFVKFVRAHVMVVARENPGKEKETVRFDWVPLWNPHEVRYCLHRPPLSSLPPPKRGGNDRK